MANPKLHDGDCTCRLCKTLAPKKYHMAKLIGTNGEVSPWCAAKPRKLNRKKEMWTLLINAVTCQKCAATYRKAKSTESGKVDANNG